MIAVNQRRIVAAVQAGRIPLGVYPERRRRVRDDGDSKSVISSTARNLSCCLHQVKIKLNRYPLNFFRACRKAAAGPVAQSDLNIATTRRYDTNHHKSTKEL